MVGLALRGVPSKELTGVEKMCLVVSRTTKYAQEPEPCPMGVSYNAGIIMLYNTSENVVCSARRDDVPFEAFPFSVLSLMP